MNISDEAVEAAHRAICDDGLDECLEWRGKCVKAVEAAAPYLIADVVADILEGMQAWAGDKELGFIQGYADASEDYAHRSAGAGE